MKFNVFDKPNRQSRACAGDAEARKRPSETRVKLIKIPYLCNMIRDFYDIDLSGRNSFHVRQRAARLVEFETTDDLTAFFQEGGAREMDGAGGGQQHSLHAGFRRCAADPARRVDRRRGRDARRRGRDARRRGRACRSGRRVGRPGGVGRRTRPVGHREPLAHPGQGRGGAGAEHRGLRRRGERCDRERRDVLHGYMQHVDPLAGTLCLRLPRERLQTCAAGGGSSSRRSPSG